MVFTNTWISTMKVPAQCLCIRHQTLQMKYVLYQPEAPQKMERRWAPPNVSAQRKGYGQWTQKKVLDRSIQAPITNLYRSVSRLTTTARLIGKRQEVEDAPMSSFPIHNKLEAIVSARRSVSSTSPPPYEISQRRLKN